MRHATTLCEAEMVRCEAGRLSREIRDEATGELQLAEAVALGAVSILAGYGGYRLRGHSEPGQVGSRGLKVISGFCMKRARLGQRELGGERPKKAATRMGPKRSTSARTTPRFGSQRPSSCSPLRTIRSRLPQAHHGGLPGVMRERLAWSHDGLPRVLQSS